MGVECEQSRKDDVGQKTDRRLAQSVNEGRVQVDLTSSPARKTGTIPKTRNNDVMSIDSSDASAASNSEEEGAVSGTPRVTTTKHSHPFLVKEMSTPAFVKAANVKTVTRILASGQQRIHCKYEDRQKVREWLETNNVEAQTNSCNNGLLHQQQKAGAFLRAIIIQSHRSNGPHSLVFSKV